MRVFNATIARSDASLGSAALANQAIVVSDICAVLDIAKFNIPADLVIVQDWRKRIAARYSES